MKAIFSTVILCVLLIVINEISSRPTIKPNQKAPKRKLDDYDDDTDDDIIENLPKKRLKKYKNVLKSENRIRNPFAVKNCEDQDDFVLLNNLARIKLDQISYGYHRETAEDMIIEGPCDLTSFNNDESIFESLETISNKDFFSLDSKKYHSYRTMLAPFATYNKNNDKRSDRSKTRITYISYFLFSVNDKMERIIEKLKNVEWNKNFYTQIKKYDYKVLKSNLLYVGSGQTKRPFEHVVLSKYLLSGLLLSTRMQAVHYYLAKGARQKLFSKVMIVPFFSSNHYPANLYSEQATIWVLKNHTLNINYFEVDKFKHKLCVEPSDPSKYLKNCLSTEAFQFVADFNVETAIRQIGQFGVVMDLLGEWEKQLQFDHQPYINSAFRVTRETTQFYKFGTIQFENGETEKAEESWRTDGWVVDNWVKLLPFNKIDFVFETDRSGWIERVRFANEILNIMIPTFSAYPKLLEASLQDLQNEYIDKLKEENFDKAKVERMQNAFKTNELPNRIKLSTLMTQLHFILEGARNRKKEFMIEKKCQIFASLKIAIVESYLERLLVFKLIFDNPNAIYIVEKHQTALPNDDNMLSLTIPEKLINKRYNILRFSHRPKQAPSKENDYECPYCGKIFKNNRDLEIHKNSVEGALSYQCSVCKARVATQTFLKKHENSVAHRLLALGQSVAFHQEMADDPLIARFSCPVCRDKHKNRYFALKENCEKHIKIHKMQGKLPFDRLNGKDSSKLSRFSCKLCSFKTSEENYAKYHLIGVHAEHVDNKNIDNLDDHFKIQRENQIKNNGNYHCRICLKTEKNKISMLQHILGNHKCDFLRVASGQPFGELKCDDCVAISEDTAEKIAPYFIIGGVNKIFATENAYKEISDILTDYWIIRKSDSNTNRYFWVFQDDEDLIVDENCFPTELMAYTDIIKRDKYKLVKEFFSISENLNSIHKNVKKWYTSVICKSTKTTKAQPEINQLAQISKFKKFVKEKNLFIRDALNEQKNYEDSIKVPEKCNKK